MTEYNRLPEEVGESEIVGDQPPEYDELEQNHEFEQFEIDENDIDLGQFGQPSSLNPRIMLARAGEASQRFADKFKSRVIQPFKHVLDPVYELYVELNRRSEILLAKVGNPLIVKRLLYVFFIASILYLITMSGTYENYTTMSYYGNFFDTQKLHDFIDNNIMVSRMQENLEYFSSMPHLSGTAGDLALARYIENHISDSALSLESSSSFHAFVNYPDVASLKIVNSNGDVIHEASVREVVDSGEDAANQIDFMAFNPGSKSGEAKGHLIYANYGFEADFKALKDRGVQLDGSIVMVKYHGNSEDAICEADKVNLASKYGAKAVIFMSDPASKSFSYDSMGVIEREPLGNSGFAPGDLLNPGEPIKLDYNNINIEELWEKSQSTVKIPSLPVSWNDAVKLLNTLKNQGNRMESWDLQFIDGTNIEVWTGTKDTDNHVELVNKVVEKPEKELWNVVGRLSGKEQDNMAIIIGAQRDATGSGTVAANSGTTILLEIMTVMSHMVHQFKWKPLRTIYFVSFDGTEYNLAGATNYAIEKSKIFRRSAYAYIDLSDAVSGTELEVSSDPLLWEVIAQSLSLVNDPVSNISLRDTNWNGNKKLMLPKEANKNYVPFITYNGIPSIDLRFKGRSYPRGSPFDDFKNFEDKEIDKDLKYHKTLTALLLKIIVNLLEKPIIPYDIAGYVSALNEFSKDLRRYALWKMGDGSDENQNAKLDFNRLETALVKLKRLGREHVSFIDTWQEIVTADGGSEPNLLAVNRWDWNSKISLMEKTLLTNSILNRPWYKNVLFGRQLVPPHVSEVPDGKGNFQFSTFPGVRDAIERHDWENAQSQLNMVSDLMEDSINFFLLN